MTKKQQKDEAILNHGLRLMRLFDLPFPDTKPATLVKELAKIERRANRYAERECNGEIEESEKRDARLLDAVDALTGYRAKGIPVFLNGDPRGYSLKIEADYMREHNVELYRDWGGYGILAPEF